MNIRIFPYFELLQQQKKIRKEKCVILNKKLRLLKIQNAKEF